MSLQSDLLRNPRRATTSILFCCAIIASTLVPLTVASPAGAVSPSSMSTPYFAGYASYPSSMSSETGQVKFHVPTVTCTNRKDEALFYFQYLEISQGNYVTAWVTAECDHGTPSYSAQADACGFTGCGGCSSTISVSPGDPMTLSESASSGNSAPLEASATDDTSGGETGCEEFGGFPMPGPVYTGICGQDVVHGTVRSASAHTVTPPPFAGCETGDRPQFSPVVFTDATVDGQALGSFPRGRYNMVADTTLQVRTLDLEREGKSFTEIFEHQ
jgi:hypothetical protein